MGAPVTTYTDQRVLGLAERWMNRMPETRHPYSLFYPMVTKHDVAAKPLMLSSETKLTDDKVMAIGNLIRAALRRGGNM